MTARYGFVNGVVASSVWPDMLAVLVHVKRRDGWRGEGSSGGDGMQEAHDFIHDPRLRTFMEIDQHHKLPKGSAFRLFKQLEPQWVEGEHFWCCDSRSQPEAFAELRRSGRLYASTVNAVLIGEAGCQSMAQVLKDLRHADHADAQRE